MLATAASRQRVRPDKAQLRDIASEVEWAKVSNVGPDDYARVALRTGRSVAGLDAETVGRLFGSYEEVKRSQSRMDMEDVLLLTAGLLADDERVAAQVRRQYKWFVVDEFQDVSPLQSALLDLWLGGRDEICVVGDPAQTIYSFAGADAGYLREFPAKYPRTTSIDLVRNYRSTPEVITAANALLAGTPSAGVRLVSQSPSGAAVGFQSYADEVAEAEAVAAAVAGLKDSGTPPGEVAVLFRINAQSEAYEEALAARGIPYVVRGAARFFDRAEVREAVTRLRGAARGDTGVPEGDLAESVGAVLSVMGWTPEAPAARGQTRDRWESLQALVDQATELAETGVTDLGVFVDDLDRRAIRAARSRGRRRHPGHPPRGQGPGVGRRLRRRRLRGHPAHHLRRHADRRRGGAPPALRRPDPRPPYPRGLVGLGPQPRRPGHPPAVAVPRPAAAGLGADAGPTTAKSRKVVSCRECGKPLATGAEKKRGRCADCPASYDEDLFEQLRTWRSGQAAEESVPAYVVFTDATLQLIAEHKPQLGRRAAAHQRHRQGQAGALRRGGPGPRGLDDLQVFLQNTWKKNCSPFAGAGYLAAPNETTLRTQTLTRSAPEALNGGGPDDQHPHRDDGQHPVVLRHARLRPRPRCLRRR